MYDFLKKVNTEENNTPVPGAAKKLGAYMGLNQAANMVNGILSKGVRNNENYNINTKAFKPVGSEALKRNMPLQIKPTASDEGNLGQGYKNTSYPTANDVKSLQHSRSLMVLI